MPRYTSRRPVPCFKVVPECGLWDVAWIEGDISTGFIGLRGNSEAGALAECARLNAWALANPPPDMAG